MNNQNSLDINRKEESNEIKNENIQRKKFINKNCIIKIFEIYFIKITFLIYKIKIKLAFKMSAYFLKYIKKIYI